MELKDIVSIAGVSGLHKIIGKTKTGLILETIGTGKRFATGVQDKVSVLEDISMYTEEGDMKLADVLIKLNEKEVAGVPDAKTDLKDLRKFLSETIKLDNERVYDSDVKKLINWYHQLKTEIDFEKLKTDAATETSATESEEHKTEKIAATKTPKKIAPKNIATKHSSKGAGGSQMTYRPKSGT